jgi:hypothetical protein
MSLVHSLLAPRLLLHINAFRGAGTASERPSPPSVHLGSVLHRPHTAREVRVFTCVLPATQYSAVMVNAAVVRRSVVYMGRLTPRSDIMPITMYSRYDMLSGSTARTTCIGTKLRTRGGSVS